MATSRQIRSVDLLIFDLDGTLIDSKLDIADCVNLTLREFGLDPLSPEVIASYVGTGIQPLLHLVSESRGIDIAEATASFTAFYAARLTNQTKLYAGMKEVLEHYHGKKKVILTNKMQRFADPIVKNLGLESFFEAVFGREAFATRKPDPLPVKEICSRFEVPAARTAIIGDTEYDLLAGKGAGVITVAALFGYGNPKTLADLSPDFSVSHPTELLTLFQ